ncbi:MAG: flagellar hook-basal body complex protein FliE [Proteobacteria bacterium]|nr:flagellar hook-basal body complex protein FliE [Pseudomonadota bacterium]NBX86405.1 flagellar hook-basal body complex protein FliE [Pseudomonadota bacterium]
MDVMKIGSGMAASLAKVGAAASDASVAGNFGDVLKNMMSQTVQAQQQASSLTLATASGDSVAMQDVVAAVSKAELTLQTLVTVRDRAVEAYQEIIRMPV